MNFLTLPKVSFTFVQLLIVQYVGVLICQILFLYNSLNYFSYGTIAGICYFSLLLLCRPPILILFSNKLFIHKAFSLCCVHIGHVEFLMQSLRVFFNGMPHDEALLQQFSFLL